MRIMIIDNETKHMDHLVKLCAHKHKVEVRAVGEDFDQEWYDLYVLNGWSHHSVFYRPSPYHSEESFLLQTNKPVIGICLGAQIMAQAYGSSFDQLPEKLSDEIDITYNGMVYRVTEAHRYSITSIGDELLSLAYSSYGHEIIKHKKKTQRWFQFHPEAHMDTTDGKRLLSLVTGIEF